MRNNEINMNRLNEYEIGYITGLFIGDGYLYHDRWRHYKVEFYLNYKKDKDVANFIVYLLKKVGLNPYFMIRDGCLIIRLNSKLLYFFIRDRTNNLFKLYSSKFNLGFISGLIDSDGYVKKGDIVISNKRKDILEYSQLFCNYLGITTKLWCQNTKLNEKSFIIWRLRIGTRFKYEKQYSQKIFRIYGGDNPKTASIIASIHSRG